MNDEEFKVVKRKKKKGKKVARTTILDGDYIRDPVDIDVAMKKIKTAVEDLMISPFLQSLKELMKDCTGCEIIWCFGLGHLAECVTARYQLAALILMKKLLNISEVNISDPIFHKEEIDILKKLNLSVVEKNNECLLQCSKKTLVFLPHCPKQLTNNLLYSNWDMDGLENLFLMCNSFSGIVERSSKTMLMKNANLIQLCLENNLVEEKPLLNNFKYDDVFNDTSLHTFTGSELLERDFWKVSKPVYDPLDTEFLRTIKA